MSNKAEARTNLQEYHWQLFDEAQKELDEWIDKQTFLADVSLVFGALMQEANMDLTLN